MQTYYAYLDNKDKQDPAIFPQFMQAFRDIASEYNLPCIDMYAWMDPWFRAEPEEYEKIMRDPWHLNSVGCAIMGTLHARAWGLPDPYMLRQEKQEVDRCLGKMAKYADLPERIEADEV
jgi:hypothetical protein